MWGRVWGNVSAGRYLVQMTNRYSKIGCPSCNQIGGIRELIFGLPMGEPDKERFALGGCCPPEIIPELRCIVCEWEGNLN